MQGAHRVLGTVLAWWCLAITAQASLRDAHVAQLEPDVDVADLLANLLGADDDEASHPALTAGVDGPDLKGYGQASVGSGFDPLTRPCLVPKLPAWASPCLALHRYVTHNTEAQGFSSLGGPPRSLWRMGSHRGPRAP